MKAKTYVTRKLKSLAEKYPQADFRYENRQPNIHLIDIYPQLFFDENLDYLVDESVIENEFETKYPDEEILFISEESLTTIKKVDLDLTIKDIRTVELKKIFDKEFKISECWMDYDAEGYRTIIRAMKMACAQCIDICAINATLDENDDVDKKSIIDSKNQINDKID